MWGAFGPSVGKLNSSLATLTKAKAFPDNVIFEYEAPRHDGRLIRLTYSFGKLEGTPGYKPRKADPRVGYFYNWHEDYARTANKEVTEQAFSPETLAWLDEYPNWDPRVRLASPAWREQMLRQRAVAAERAATEDLKSETHPWTHGINDPTNTACKIGRMLSLEFALVDAAMVAGALDTESEDLLDGLPEEYLGPMIRYISCHEVGHCMGLQHNMAASTIRTLEEINSEGYEGPTVGSVMDYVGVNINHELGEVQGAYASPELGPYDKWAIAFGYGPEEDLDEVLARVSEPDNIFVSQLAMAVGSDPRNMTWDLGANNLNFVESRISLAQELRGKLIEDLVKDGDSWKIARERLYSLLGTQLHGIFIASNWIGSSYINNDFKGDPGDRAPIEDVPAADQRRALQIVVENAFEDEAFGLTPDLIRHLGREYWWDPSEFDGLFEDPSFNAHDIVGGIQATALTLIMNPTRLRRIYDNEYRMQDADDVFTLAEVVTTVTDAIWTECAEVSSRSYSAEAPMVSSFRRNLQREHVGRLVDLALLPDVPSPALRTISSMATQELRRIKQMATRARKASLDPYTDAHLADIRTRIGKALDAAYVIKP